MPGFSVDTLVLGIIQLICFVPAIVVHEVAHGFVAYKLGDPTAKRMGRLSLNPLKHIDPFGTVLLPVILAFLGGPVFGYAKPVPYNPRYFKNLKKGEVMTGMAGPAANLVMALIAATITFLLVFFKVLSGPIAPWIYTILWLFGYINLILMFFNLIPLPPLDGSSLIVPFLPQKAMPTWYQIQRYAFPIFFILVFVVPWVLRINPLWIYLNATAGNLVHLLFP